MLTILDWITIIIASGSMIISLIALYFSSFSRGKITFPAINFIAAQAYATSNGNAISIINDRIVIPITAINSGSKARSVRFKAVINNERIFHNTIGFETIRLPTPTKTMTLDTFQVINPQFVIMPKSSTTNILGFTQLPLIGSEMRDLIIDVWYQEDAGVKHWKKAFRVVWDQWANLVQTYLKGNFVSSVNLKFFCKFDEKYKDRILEEN